MLVTQAHLFKPTFPASKERMLGPQAIFFQQGDYHAHLRGFPGQTAQDRLANPAWHLHAGAPPQSDMVVPYSMLLNLASAARADRDVSASGRPSGTTAEK